MHVRQAANVVELFEFFAKRGAPATLAEIADALGWPRSSTFNIVGTLVEKGYVYEPSMRGGYFPSPRWQTVIQTIAEQDPLPDALIDLVDEISARTGETTAVECASGPSVIFLYVRESRQPIRYFAEVGTRVPIHASSAGRAILAQMKPRDRDALYRKLVFEKYSGTTPTDVGQIEEELSAATIRAIPNISPILPASRSRSRSRGSASPSWSPVRCRAVSKEGPKQQGSWPPRFAMPVSPRPA